MANRTWTSSSTNTGSYNSKWGSAFAANWSGSIVPTINDVAIFEFNSFNKYAIQIQPNTVTGGIRFKSYTGGSDYFFSTNPLTIGTLGINNDSGRNHSFASVYASGNQTWTSTGANSSITLAGVNFITNNTTITSSSKITINQLTSSTTNNKMLVTGGSLVIYGGEPTSDINFQVDTGYLTTNNPSSGGFNFDSSLSSLTIAGAEGVYNNSLTGSVCGSTNWHSVTMSSGSIDLMGIDGNLVVSPSGYVQTGGTLNTYVGYDGGVTFSSVQSLINEDPSGSLTFGGTLNIDFAGCSTQSFSHNTYWTLFQGINDGSNFNNIILSNVDGDSPYAGLSFNAPVSPDRIWRTSLGTDSTYLNFDPDTGRLSVFSEGVTYYYNGAVNSHWNTIGNWWSDSVYTEQAPAAPSLYDHANLISSCTSASGTIVVKSLTMTDPSGVNPTLDISIVVSETGLATFEQTCTYANNTSKILTGNAVFNDYCVNKGYINGNATFHDYSSNYGSIENSGLFNESSSSINATLTTADGLLFNNNTTSSDTDILLGGSANVLIDGSQIALTSIDPLTFTRSQYGTGTNNSNILGLP